MSFHHLFHTLFVRSKLLATSQIRVEEIHNGVTARRRGSLRAIFESFLSHLPWEKFHLADVWVLKWLIQVTSFKSQVNNYKNQPYGTIWPNKSLHKLPK